MKIVVLSLSIALSGTFGSPSTCSAQFKPGARPASPTACRAYIPARGSTTRKQIADALRRKVGATTGVFAVFVFDWIKVNGNWAYVQTSPQSADGESQYEPVSALLRRRNGLWSVAAIEETDVSPAQAQRRLKKRFPSAPRDIFPG